MNRYEKFVQRLHRGEQVLIDGATGTEIERRGVPMVDNAWNGGGAMTHPAIVRQVHEDYIRAGARIVISNTFATSRSVLRQVGMEADFEFLNRRGVELAQEARANTPVSGVLVAGGISHWSYTGVYPAGAELQEHTEEQAAIMYAAGADLFMLEMMINIERMTIVLEAAQKTGSPVWVGMSCQVDEKGDVRLWDGALLTDALDVVRDKNVPLVNIMHTEVEYVNAALDVLEKNWDGMVGVYAHSGRFIDPNWLFNDTISTTDYASAASGWLQRGIQVIGGCCGVGLEHIQLLNQSL